MRGLSLRGLIGRLRDLLAVYRNAESSGNDSGNESVAVVLGTQVLAGGGPVGRLKPASTTPPGCTPGEG